MMGSRRRAREAALQALYQMDLNPGLTPAQALAHIFETFARGEPAEADEADLRTFTTRLVTGVIERRAQIDELLANASTHWRLDRMAAVDRNLLRLGVEEILFETEIPASVTIDEAVEIAKRYGTSESPAFVNGVLQRIAADHKPNK
jgi:transcription antitermination protein NusB